VIDADPLRARLPALVAQLEAAKQASEAWQQSDEVNANELVCEVLTPAIEAALAALRREPPTQLDRSLAVLREKFDARTIAEVKFYHGIPTLPLEEVELREAIAVVLQTARPAAPEEKS